MTFIVAIPLLNEEQGRSWLQCFPALESLTVEFARYRIARITPQPDSFPPYMAPPVKDYSTDARPLKIAPSIQPDVASLRPGTTYFDEGTGVRVPLTRSCAITVG